MEKGYSAKEPTMKKGGDKDASAYKESAKGVSGKKAAKLDSLGGTKSKNEPLYKANCKDE